MPDQVLPGLVLNNTSVREAVCIHTKKVYDACRDKDCIDNLRVYPTVSSLEALRCSTALTGIRAEIICVSVTVRPAPYSPGFFTVGITYYYKIFAETSGCGCTGVCVTGLGIFNKTAVLCGGQGGVKIFSSRNTTCTPGGVQGTPEAVVEALDPILLDIKVLEGCCPCPGEVVCDTSDFPQAVIDAFNGEELVLGDDVKRVFVTLGQFSIIKLERDAQLIVPVYDNCLPTKSCTPSQTAGATSPCDVFSQIQFPTSLFFPESCDSTETAVDSTTSCGTCGADSTCGSCG